MIVDEYGYLFEVMFDVNFFDDIMVVVEVDIVLFCIICV